jgi:hypothetical protein
MHLNFKNCVFIKNCPKNRQNKILFKTFHHLSLAHKKPPWVFFWKFQTTQNSTKKSNFFRRPDFNERPFLPYNIRYEVEDEEDEGAIYDSHVLSTPASSASSAANQSPDEGIDGMFSAAEDSGKFVFIWSVCGNGL